VWLRPFLYLLELLGRLFGKRRAAPVFRWDIDPGRAIARSRLDWWMQLTERPVRELEFLLRLSEELPSLPQGELLRGIGYTLANGWDWSPLLLVDAELLEVPPATRPLAPAEIHADMSKLLYGPLSDVPGALLLPVGPARALSGRTSWGLVGEIDSRDYGTEGVRIIRADGNGGWRPGFLTAGHAIPGGLEKAVVKLPRRRLARRAGDLFGRRWAPRLGTVAFHNSPAASDGIGGSGQAESPGFDFAVVDLDRVDADDWTAYEFAPTLAPALQEIQHAIRLAVLGGVSGYVDHVSVTGALFTAEHRWKDCWILGPSSALQAGDSGSVAFLHDTGETFGMVVGGTVGWGEAHHLYVQSLERLMADCLSPKVKILTERTI
jgi:hypothetical protein